MTDLFLQEKRLDIARAAELFPVVRALCFLPRPTAEDEIEYKKDAGRHVSYALNTPRPVGVEAMIRYGRWIKLATPETEFTRASLAPVLEILEQKLNAAEEPSVAVREMLGMQFRTACMVRRRLVPVCNPEIVSRQRGSLEGGEDTRSFRMERLPPIWRDRLRYGACNAQTLFRWH